MRARKGAAARLSRAGIVALILGIGTFGLLATETRSCATEEFSNDSRSRPSLIVTPDREFAAPSYVHQQLRPNNPRDTHPDAWVADLQRQIGRYYGVVSVFAAAIDQPTVRVREERASDLTGTFEPLQQQWQTVALPDGLRGAWGGKIDDLASNPGYFPTTPEGYKFGITVTGLALLAGRITVAEQRQGAINHSIHIALAQTRRSVWVPPAQRSDGEECDPNAIPQGTTFRSPQSVDLNQIELDFYARIIARAV